MENSTLIGKRIISFIDRISQEHRGSLIIKEDSKHGDFIVYYINYYYLDDSLIDKLVVIVPDPNINYNQNRVNNIISHYNSKFTHIVFIDYKRLIKSNNLNIINDEQLFVFLLNIKKYYHEFFSDDPDVIKIKNGKYVKRNFNIINTFDFPEKHGNFIDSIMSIWLKRRGASPILLIGDRGIGKTYSLKKLCIEINEKHFKNPWIEPAAIYFDLGDMKNHPLKSSSLIKFIIDVNSNINTINSLGSSFQYNIWESFLKTNKIMLLLDGFDEIKEKNTESLMSYYVKEIINLVSDYPKTIIASRSNHFDSIEQIKRLFTIGSDLDKEDDAANFNILQLDILSSEEYSKFSDVKIVDDKTIGIGNLKTTLSKVIKDDILELSYIPAFYDVLTSLIKNTKLSGVDIIETSVLKAVIEFNVDHQRSIQYINTILDDKIDFLPFQAEEKFDLIKDFSWFLFERGYDKSFPLSKLYEFISSRFDNQDIEKLTNDVKTQTVFSIQKDNNKLRFLTNGLYSFFISKYIYKLLCNIENIKEGIIILGRYDFTSEKVGIYLKEMLLSETQIYNNIKNQIDNFNYLVGSNFRFLDNNLITLSLRKETSESGKFWQEINTSVKKYSFTNDYFLFIKVSKEEIKSFFIKKTEVTNKEFEQFLSDTDTKFQVDLWKRSAVNKKDNKFEAGYNDYFLLHWLNDEMPSKLEDHPLVYVSWFAAAYYCNWLSKKDKLTPYYDFKDFNDVKIPKGGKKIRRNDKSNGYRLPTEDEWEFVARGGNYEINYPWEKYRVNNSTELNEYGVKYKNDLLNNEVYSIPVMNDAPNDFGIYGQIGNVREWVDKNPGSDDEYISVAEKMPIKGATWLLGEEGFKFSNKVEIYAENTNFDVGFRVARSLTAEESNILEKYKL